jgi:D-serine deaminase-like pyridoxal phosphate-dependent protein
MKIIRPTLILDKQKCLKNIEMMVSKARKHNLKFRPHFKTHQSAEIGNWFKGFRVNCITVSSVKMAAYFADNGWNDITIAFPLNILEMEEINKLTSKLNLNVIIISMESLTFLAEHSKNKIGVYVKIDTGTHRTGILPENKTLISSLVFEIKKHPNIIFKGFLAHTGHTYQAKNKSEIEIIHKAANNKLVELRDFYKNDFEKIEISIGDTPSCSLMDDFNGIDEIRPGNFVFYDVMQYYLGSCSFDQIAIALASPVVAKHPERNEIIVYGGAVHLSKDCIEIDGVKSFGLTVMFEENRWSEPIKGVYVKSLSQEHGIIKVDHNQDFFDKINIGDVVGILPIHSCLTADLMKEYLTFEGEKIEMMR